MQTFVPYADIKKSLEVLDRQRLGKQRVEAWQIITVLNTGNTSKIGWINHPAVKMWADYQECLIHYYNTALDIWRSRGYKNKKLKPLARTKYIIYPHWWGGPIHASHRSRLLIKDYRHYSQFWDYSNTPFGMEYVWPV